MERDPVEEDDDDIVDLVKSLICSMEQQRKAKGLRKMF